MATEEINLRIKTGADRKRAIVRLDELMIASIFELPPGVYVAGVHADFLSRSVLVMIEGDALDIEPTPPGHMALQLLVELRYDADEQRIRFTPPVTS